MQNEHNNKPSPSSRRPLSQVEEIEGQEDPALPHNVIRSSLLRSSSSGQWTPPTQSFSSYSSQEYDAFSHIQTHDPQPPPSMTSPFHHATRPVVGSQSSGFQYPPAASHLYHPEYYSEEVPISSHLTQSAAPQFLDPYSGATYPPPLPDILESQGPPLPYPYLAQQQSRYAERESPEPRRLSLSEATPHSRRTQGTRSARSSRGSSPAEPYHGRRLSHDLRSHPHPMHPAPPQSFQTSHPTSRPPFRASRSYPMTSGRVEYAPYPRTAVPASQPSPTSGLPSLAPSPMGPPISGLPAGMLPFALQAPPVGRGTPPLTLPAYGTTPVYGARPLPNVGELTDIPSSRQLDYGVVAPPTRLPPVQALVSPQMSRRSRPVARVPISPITHELRTPQERRQLYPQLGEPMQKRRKPPDPFTSYAIMLADIIRDSPRKKMTLQELYDYLKVRYPEHFPDDGFDDKAEGKTGYGGGWRNTVRHALSVNKWFKKQYRTDADAKLDEIDPNRPEPSPIDNEDDSVAPPTDRSHMTGPLPGGHRPLKGGYWFIREMYRAEVDAAIARDKEKLGRPRPELEASLVPHSMPTMLEDTRRESAIPTVGHSRQPSVQPGILPNLPRPPGPLPDPLDQDQPRPTFPPPPPSRTWPYPPT